MTEYHVLIGPLYAAEYEQIEQYLVAMNTTSASVAKIFKRIDADADRLATSPFIGPRLEKRTRIPNDYRYIVSGLYIQFYTVDEAARIVKLLQIVDGRSDYIARLGLA